MNPLGLLERLAVLVPPPRRPLLAYHGLLAPRAEWRSTIVPPPAPDDARGATAARVLRDGGRGHSSSTACSRSKSWCATAARGPRRILGAVTEPHAVRRVLARSAWPPSRRPADPCLPPDPCARSRPTPDTALPVCLPTRRRGVPAPPLRAPAALAGPASDALSFGRGRWRRGRCWTRGQRRERGHRARREGTRKRG